jgi:hypothetical protein
MNKVLRLTSLLMITLLFTFVTGCNKDDDDNGGGIGSGSIKAKINGETVKFGNINAGSALGVIAIDGTKDQWKISFLLPADIGEGEHALSSNQINYSVILEDGDEMTMGNGTIKVTKHNEGSNELKATFHFTGNSIPGNKSYNVTDGELDVKYKETN